MRRTPVLEQRLILRKKAILAALALGGLSAVPAAAEIRFELQYVDQGTGFDDPVMGQARKLAMEQSAQITASFFPEQNAVIRLRVDGTVTEDSTLASAGSFGPRSCNVGFDNRGDVLTIALGGADPDPNDVDGEVSVNFEDVVWGLDDSIGPDAFDFKSTMIHELLHALGFSGTLGQEPVDACSARPPQAGSFDPFDKHLGDATGPIINNTTAVMDAARWSAAVVGGTGNAGLQWHGTNGVAANNGQPIPLFSPAEFSNGSSIAHLDDDFYTGVALLMESATGTGQGVRTLSPMERGMMMDLGYSASGDNGGGGETVQLALNGQLNANLAAGQIQRYTLTVDQAGTLVLASAGGLDLVGRLLFGGQEVAANDDISPDDVNFGITLNLQNTGTYTLEVVGFNDTVAGPYQLTAQFSPQQGGGGGGDSGGDCPRIIDDDGNLWNSTIQACDGTTIQADEAQLYRAYSGAFARIPDVGGYNWWLTEIRAGRHDLGSMLAGFLFSTEFLGLVNAPDGNSIDNTAFLVHIFQNVFGRQPDEEGFNFWFGELQSGSRTQARVLEEMTQSNEFVEKTVNDVVTFVQQR